MGVIEAIFVLFFVQQFNREIGPLNDSELTTKAQRKSSVVHLTSTALEWRRWWNEAVEAAPGGAEVEAEAEPGLVEAAEGMEAHDSDSVGFYAGYAGSDAWSRWSRSRRSRGQGGGICVWTGRYSGFPASSEPGPKCPYHPPWMSPLVKSQIPPQDAQ